MSDSNSKKVSHTPGPWEYFIEDQVVIIDGDYSKKIADIRGWGWLQKLPDGEQIQDANGRLIAAGPDMKEALQRCVKAMEFIMNRYPETSIDLMQDHFNATQVLKKVDDL